MTFGNRNSIFARIYLAFALLAGMLGTTRVHPARAADYVVTNSNSSGLGSLRDSISLAATSGGGIITFDPSLAGQTITFTSQLYLPTLAHVTIDGSGLNLPVTVSGGNTSGILKIAGGGIFDISDLVFTQAVAEDGGAIEISGTTQLSLENCSFVQNQATDSGGAIAASGSGAVNIISSTFHQNQAGGSGGALFASGNNVSIVGSTFLNNDAAGNGGAIAAGIVSLSDSTLSGNSAGGSGGAISASILNIQNSTIDHNQAVAGGAIRVPGNGISSIANSTLAHNEATQSGGAIFLQGNLVLNVFNSTFAANQAPYGSELSLPIGVVSVSLSNTILVCIPGNTSCIEQGFGTVAGGSLWTGTLDSVGLAELADNGGPTQTMALLPGSPFLDAGDDTICANDVVNHQDQRGVARPQGSHCDIGAYEDQPLIRYVKQDATGTGDGSSWANAHTDLQAALAAASSDEEIWVAAGTYKPTSTPDRSISFVLKNGVAVYGGFAGNETARTQRNHEINLTVLSGDIGVQGNISDNSYHVVVGSNTNNSAILDGFTITAGNANDASSPYSSGGGMYINKGAPRLNGLIFTENHARFGGGIYASHTEGNDLTVDLIMTNVVFRDNTATGEGGGIATLFYPDLSSASFRLSLTNVIFENNTAARTGGGMINNGGELELADVTFLGNTAAGGGGLSNIPYTSSTLTNVTFSNNSASDGGGGMLVGSDGSNLTTLTDVTFNNNSTALNGGGIANAGYSNLLLTDVTFSENTAGANGGGIFNGAFFNVESGGTVNLIHTTFRNNVANANGGAVYNESGNIGIHNSILYGDSGGEIYDSSGPAVVTHSIIQGGYTGTGNIDQDPLLGPLQDNGGLTETMALGDGSPAINTADDTRCPATDQRGVARPQGSHCDMGAYEYDKSMIDVIIGESTVGSYAFASQESQRKSYPGLNAGPVKVTNTADTSMMAAERVIYKINNVPTSFSEMMGLPAAQLDTTYWLPWYNNASASGLDTQLRFANLGASEATVHVYIGGQEMQDSPFTLAAGVSTRKSFPGINNGPVKIESSTIIVAAERVIYKINGIPTSFSETMALPNNQLNSTYWLPWYNNASASGLDTQLRFANVTDQTATVHVYIAGQEVPGSPITLAAGESTRQSFPGINNGPVKIQSDRNIVAAERVIYKINGKQVSFSETMALPNSQLDTTYWLPWYNNTSAGGLDTQLRFANVTDQEATVHIYIGGQEVAGSPFTLAAGASTRKSFPGLDHGPVKIVSNVDIVAAQRVIYRINGTPTSFSELMGLPNALLDATFWFPWYNNTSASGLDTQLRFGLP